MMMRRLVLAAALLVTSLTAALAQTSEQRSFFFFRPFYWPVGGGVPCNNLIDDNAAITLPEVVVDDAGNIALLPDPTPIIGFDIISSPFNDGYVGGVLSSWTAIGTLSFGLDRARAFSRPPSNWPLAESTSRCCETLGVLDILRGRDPNPTRPFSPPVMYSRSRGDAILIAHNCVGTTMPMNVAFGVRTALTMPLASVTPTGNDINTVLLLHGDGIDKSINTSDSSQRNYYLRYPYAVTTSPPTVPTSYISTSQAKFGTGSLYFGGYGGWGLSAGWVRPAAYGEDSPDTDWDIGSRDWTIDLWVRPSVTRTRATVVGLPARVPFVGAPYPWAITALGPWVIEQVGATMTFSASSAGSSTRDVANAVSLGSTPLNTWSHIAVVRSGATIRLFNGGAQVGATITVSGALAAGGPLQIGNGLNGTPDWYTGYVDELRFSNVARWTSGFTPAASQFGP